MGQLYNCFFENRFFQSVGRYTVIHSNEKEISTTISLTKLSSRFVTLFSSQFWDKEHILGGAHLVRPMCATWGKVVTKHIFIQAKMVDFLIGHYTRRMFTPDTDIIPTSLAVTLLYRKIHKISMSYFLLCTHKATQSSYFHRLCHRSRKLAHQREVVECLVGIFCKYNVL